MAESIDIAVTAVPVALEDTIPGAMLGQRLTVSNDSRALVFWRVAAVAPDADAKGHPIPPYRSASVIFAMGPEKSWLWTRDPPGVLVVTEEGG